MSRAAPAALAVVREPAVPVLVLAGATQVYRAYAVDVLLFLGTLVLIVTERRRWGPDTRDATPPARPRPAAVVVTAAAAAYAVAVSFVPQTTWWLDACLAVPGIAVLALALAPRRPGARRRDPVVEAPGRDLPAPRHWWVWPGLGIALALVELFSFLSQPDARTDSYEHPTLSTIVEPPLDSMPWLRALALFAWALIGWWLLRRVRAWLGRTP
jgi:hypothetical protein